MYYSDEALDKRKGVIELSKILSINPVEEL